MIYLITLDSHDYFGPFFDEADAKYWALKTYRTSYQLLSASSVPTYVRDQAQTPRF